jgi:DNA-binding transcriptional regulator of glucitol operon
MVWNVLTLGAMVTCGLLAAWQWSRAGSAMGSALNVGYGLQWPVFAVFFGVMWWRMLRMEARGPAGEQPDGSAGTAEPVAAEAVVPEPAPRPAPAGDSPFTARPRIPVPVLTPDENPQLTEYNRLLRRLAEQDGGK